MKSERNCGRTFCAFQTNYRDYEKINETGKFTLVHIKLKTQIKLTRTYNYIWEVQFELMLYFYHLFKLFWLESFN